MAAICTKKAWKSIDKQREVKTMSEAKHPARLGKILVLGLGNTVLSDDGVGIYAMREIEKLVSMKSVDFDEASLGGLELLDRIRGYDRVFIIDAVQTGKVDVGEVVKLKIDDLKGGSAMARHQVPFHEALMLGQRLGMDLPEEIVIYGIEVKEILTFSESCTREVESCIPRIVRTIIEDAGLEDQKQGKEIRSE